LINVRGISDAPTLAIRLLKQVIRGMQENRLATSAKHFPGDGLDYRDQHIVTTNNTASLRPIPTIRTGFLALSVHKKRL